MDNAFRYVKDYGIDTEESYPYKGVQNLLCFYNSASVGATCSGKVNDERFSLDFDPDRKNLRGAIFFTFYN